MQWLMNLDAREWLLRQFGPASLAGRAHLLLLGGFGLSATIFYVCTDIAGKIAVQLRSCHERWGAAR